MPDSTATTTTSTAPQQPGTGPDLMTQAATVATLPFTLAKQLLPDNPVPVAVGAGALAVAGVIDWPVAAAVGLGYLALRRWHEPATGGRPVRSATTPPEPGVAAPAEPRAAGAGMPATAGG